MVLNCTDLAVRPGELAISAVSLAELHFGVLVAKSADVRAARLARLGSPGRRFDPLAVGEAVVDSYRLPAARVVEVGRTPLPGPLTC